MAPTTPTPFSHNKSQWSPARPPISMAGLHTLGLPPCSGSVSLVLSWACPQAVLPQEGGAAPVLQAPLVGTRAWAGMPRQVTVRGAGPSPALPRQKPFPWSLQRLAGILQEHL